MLLYILDINYLSSSAILGFRTTIPLYSSLYYRPIFLAKTFLSVLETCANISSRLYTIRTCRYCTYSTKSFYILLLSGFYLLLRTKHSDNNSIYPPPHTLFSVLLYTAYVLYYMLGSRGVLRVLALYSLSLRL